MMFRYLFFMIITLGLTSCAQSQEDKARPPIQTNTTEEGYKKAYFASGCFWCSESIYESVIGVIEVTSGYSGGKGDHPTYENYERKGHAETIEVLYDPKVISYTDLLDVYFSSQNVTQQNGQGPDQSQGYRSLIFYQNKEQKEEALAKIKEVQKNHQQTVAAKILPFQKFYKAEAYHQDFEKNNPNNSYIQRVSLPRLNDFKSKHPELLKENN